jgi:hypothetical protein
MKESRRDTIHRLALLAVFAVAMGWLEGVLALYLRKLIGLEGSLDLMDPRTSELLFRKFAVMTAAGEGGHLTPKFLFVEQSREAVTIVMLACVALLSAQDWRRRAAYFLFTFGVWDIVYYGTLWTLLRWPPSWGTLDLLFLIPGPWIAQAWIPMAISVCFIAWGVWTVFDAVPARRRRR